MLNRLFRRKDYDAVARRLYDAIVAQARRPEFYRDWGVPDTLDGRFDMIALHSFLVMHRLKQDHEATAEYRSRHHSSTLPCMSWRPKSLGNFWPTG